MRMKMDCHLSCRIKAGIQQWRWCDSSADLEGCTAIGYSLKGLLGSDPSWK